MDLSDFRPFPAQKENFGRHKFNGDSDGEEFSDTKADKRGRGML
jgi:hypothetical protein